MRSTHEMLCALFLGSGRDLMFILILLVVVLTVLILIFIISKRSVLRSSPQGKNLFGHLARANELTREECDLLHIMSIAQGHDNPSLYFVSPSEFAKAADIVEMGTVNTDDLAKKLYMTEKGNERAS